jgi:uncharacterized protein YcaQ
MPEELSAAQARRLQLAAQGLAGTRLGERGGRVDRRHFRQVLDRLALVQLDSVNVITRAHELAFFARLGPYDRGALARWLHDSGEVFEYWAHAACFLPVDLHPSLRWKMERYAVSAEREQTRQLLAKRAGYLDEVRAAVRDRGPLTPGELHPGVAREKRGPWWGWDLPKRSLEYLFAIGEVTATRNHRFERFYELPERVLPAAILDQPSPPEDEARRELVRRAASALGVGTADDLCTYFYQQPTKGRPVVKAMAADGELLEVRVEGWAKPGYLLPGTKVPRQARGRALLAPFDSLCFDRDRAGRVFDFTYKIEIYTPAPKRVYGYYVLPFLLGDRLAGRVDLKADRAGGRLLARASWAEPLVDRDEAATELAAELRLMAGWLGLDDVVAVRKGDLAPALRRALSD